MAILDLYVSALGTEKTAWTRVGISPYLNAQDEPTSYVWNATKKAEIGDFDFADSGKSSETINSVILYVYAKYVGARSLSCFIWESGTGWTEYIITPDATYGWKSIIVTVLDTWAKIDSAKLYIKAANSTDRVDVDAVYLKIDYTSGATEVEKDFVVDAMIQDTFTKNFVMDAMLLQEGIKDFAVDAMILLPYVVRDFVVDGILFAEFEKDFEVDALIQDSVEKDFDVDGVLQDTFEKTFAVDGRLVNVNTKSFDVDAMIQDSFEKDFEVDAMIQDSVEKNFDVDAILVKAVEKDFVVDGVLQATFTKDFQVDAILTTTYKLEGITKDRAGDALGSCDVRLYLSSNDAYQESTVSNAVTGAYSFTGLSNDDLRYIIAYKTGTPVFGTSDDLTPVEE